VGPTFLITGASGFLGQTLIETAVATWSDVTVLPIHSPSSHGIDLAESGAPEKLAVAINVPNPKNTVLIHAAAAVEWDSPEGLLANASMALNVAKWAKSANLGFSLLVSGVNVYAPLPQADALTPCEPIVSP